VRSGGDDRRYKDSLERRDKAARAIGGMKGREGGGGRERERRGEGSRWDRR